MKNERFPNKYRHWIQAAWFALTNGYARGYVKGEIFVGNTKAICVPGLNCYSCPGAIAHVQLGLCRQCLVLQVIVFLCMSSDFFH